MSKKLSHIGVAVANLTEAVSVFSTLLEKEPECFEEIADQKIKTAIFVLGDSRIELLVGTSADSPISKFLEKRGPGIHHMAIRVDDLDGELARLTEAGVRLIDSTPRIGAEGARIAFIHPKATAGILVELQEQK